MPTKYTLPLLCIVIAAVLGAACGGSTPAPPAAPTVPVDLVKQLVAGQAPSPLNHFASMCVVEADGPTLYSAQCGQFLFIVNVETGSVVPGNAATRVHYDEATIVARDETEPIPTIAPYVRPTLIPQPPSYTCNTFGSLTTCAPD